MEEKMLVNALFYLKQGLPIFPVGWDNERKSRKKPLLEWKEYQKRLPTEEEVTKWWTSWPDAGIGMATGSLSGFVVVDAEAGADFGLFGFDHFETPTSKTGGGGRHWFFKYQNLKNAVKFAPLYDFRGEGGYVLLPPSPHQSGNTYEWIIPFGLANAAELPLNVSERLKNRTSEAVSKLLIQTIPEGARNSSATSVAGSLLKHFKPIEWESKSWPLLIAWNEKHASPPLQEPELRSAFESIAKRELERRRREDSGTRLFNESDLQSTFTATDTSVVVTLKTDDGEAVFEFSEIEQSKKREIDCLLTVELRVPGFTPKPFDGRLNVLSLSAREGCARQLSRSFGKNLPWDLLLSRASSLLRKYLADRDTSIWIEDSPPLQTNYLFYPFIVGNGANLFFGKGGSGKTMVALRIALALITKKDFIGYTPKDTCRVLFVDYESSPEDINNRLIQLMGDKNFNPELEETLQRIRYFSPQGTPFIDCVPALQKIISTYKIGLVIVDSAALACGGEPEKAASAIVYFNALAKLGIPSLTIAHETKSEERQYAFGSIFFHNCPRNIWNVRSESEQNEKIINVGLFHRKSNIDRLQSPHACKFYFGNGIIETSIGDRSIWEEEFTLTKRILWTLKDGSKSLSDMRDALSDVKDSTLKRGLWRVKKKGLIDHNEETHQWFIINPYVRT